MRGPASRLWLVPLVAALCGCGVPTASQPERLPTVPYGLTDTAGPTRSTPSVQVSTGPRIWLLRGEQLVAAAPVPTQRDTRGTASAALARLAAGPTDQQRADGLSSALGPSVLLRLTDLAQGRATVDITSGDQAPSPGRLPRAVGQVVLTLVSVDGVDAVVLTSDGQPVQAPLPGGALTDRPLTADDYAALQAS